jgi:hypothetical protein
MVYGGSAGTTNCDAIVVWAGDDGVPLDMLQYAKNGMDLVLDRS